MRDASCGRRPRSSSPGLERGSLGEVIEREALCRSRGSKIVGKHAIRGDAEDNTCLRCDRKFTGSRGSQSARGFVGRVPGCRKDGTRVCLRSCVLGTSSRSTRQPAFFFLFETKRGQDGIGWSHISRDLGIGEIATQGRPKQSGEKCATVSSSSSSGACYLLLFLPTCVAMSCWGRNNYAKRRKSSPDMDGADIAGSLDGYRLVPTSPNDQGRRELS